MARGFFSGVFWGVLASGLTVGTVSLMEGISYVWHTPVVAEAVEAPVGTGFNGERAEETPLVPQTVSTVVSGDAPASLGEVTAGSKPTMTMANGAVGAPVIAATDGQAADITAPASEYIVASIAPGIDTPVMTVSPKVEPSVPPADTAPLSIANPGDTLEITEVAMSQMAGMREGGGTVHYPVKLPKPELKEAVMPETVMPFAALPDAAMPKTQVPQAPPQEVAKPGIEETDLAGSETALVEPATPLEVEEAKLPEIVVPEPETPRGGQSEIATLEIGQPEDSGPQGIEAEVVLPETTQTETGAEAPAAIRVDVSEIGNLAPEVRTNRLAGIGRENDVGQEATPEDEAVEAAPVSDVALVANSVAFENPEGRPLLSVVLLDDPANPITDAALSHLPFALSFAIDATREDAPEVAARYRAAGFEVLLLATLPPVAQANDVEVAFEAYSAAIPTAVAVLDGGDSSYLSGANLARRISGILADSGHGFVALGKGLNSATKIAARDGVPAAVVYRVLDAKSESPGAISRHLDRAAFQATQDGHVIVLGHTTPETTEALVFWALGSKAESVVIAPVSAVLRGL